MAQDQLEQYRRLFDLTGRRAVVIGAGSGIGAAAATALAAHGAAVTCADVDEGAVRAVAGRLREEGADASDAYVDLADEAGVEGLLRGAAPVDILVSTPSINVRKPIVDTGLDEFDRVVGLNLRGTFVAARAAARLMSEAGRGSIILTASIRATTVEPGQGVYAATKAGTVQLARTLAAELGRSGVRANAIAPGVVETPLTAPIASDRSWYRAYADKSALRRWSTPAEIAGAVVYLASDAASFVTGTVLHVDGGWTAVDGRFDPPLP
ncbi:MAG: SDR family oxidoreductase [Actinomycetota bacterium]|nr:SDR family oxidoreductase [Actinomycetota bacterium]